MKLKNFLQMIVEQVENKPSMLEMEVVEYEWNSVSEDYDPVFLSDMFDNYNEVYFE